LIPNVVAAVDVVLFTVRSTARVDDAWQVLLVQRDDAAFGGHWSLPGVLVRSEETFDEAARRALRSKAGLDARDWYLEQLATFGRPDRDSRGRVVSVAHAALVRTDHLELAPGADVLRIAWFPVSELPWEELAFDHGDMLRTAIDRVRSKVRYSWVAFQLLPEKFTLPELRAVYAAILDPSLVRLNTSNFKKASSVPAHSSRPASAPPPRAPAGPASCTSSPGRSLVPGAASSAGKAARAGRAPPGSSSIRDRRRLPHDLIVVANRRGPGGWCSWRTGAHGSGGRHQLSPQ
jgi:8-oxo-dGTP diphosphatase